MLQDELAIAQLQPGLEGGGKECMPSFYASICDKNIDASSSPQTRLPQTNRNVFQNAYDARDSLLKRAAGCMSRACSRSLLSCDHIPDTHRLVLAMGPRP